MVSIESIAVGNVGDSVTVGVTSSVGTMVGVRVGFAVAVGAAVRDGIGTGVSGIGLENTPLTTTTMVMIIVVTAVVTVTRTDMINANNLPDIIFHLPRLDAEVPIPPGEPNHAPSWL